MSINKLVNFKLIFGVIVSLNKFDFLYILLKLK